ncbi:MAG: 2-oxoacid:ferredoxin oxidoreductase subunit beta [Thermoproteota archaeon]|nr:MAG: 2-oxoacid:ferredoxin oxidoreductase subunit beta [Candidatus Korarchaeota archaeon]
MLTHPLDPYLRPETLPTPFCPGCGCGIVASAFLRAARELGHSDLSGFVFVSGIGCSSWIPSPHFKADSIHILHGRSIPTAMGVKAVRPELEVVVFGGDGDLASIGLGHLVHAARRNLEVLVIMVNNMVYGMTGGQLAPTTPRGAVTATSPYGNPESPIDMVRTLAAAGASYVARGCVAYPRHLEKLMLEALQASGFRFVEAVSTCTTHFQLMLGTKSPVEALKKLRELVEFRDVMQGPREGRLPLGSWRPPGRRPGFVESLRGLR